MKTGVHAAVAMALSVGLGPMTSAEGGATAPGSASRGKAVYGAQCGLCHGLGAGDAGQGPDLNGVIGRPPAAAKDYPFTDALKAKAGALWTVQSLDAFLKDPQAFAPGTTMPIAVSRAEDRADLIAFLSTTK
jgi:cytochrome c2